MRKPTGRKRVTATQKTAKIADRNPRPPARCNPFAGTGNGFSTYDDIHDQTEEQRANYAPEMRF
jgi:hypothetical protein